MLSGGNRGWMLPEEQKHWHLGDVADKGLSLVFFFLLWLLVSAPP